MLLIAAATGTAVMGRRAPLAMRSAIGMAVAGQIFVVLGTMGMLRPWSLCAFAVVACVAPAARRLDRRRLAGDFPRHRAGGGPAGQRPALQMGVAALFILPLFLLALYPPIAFDETLYHLPFVQAIARSGAIGLTPDLRFPIFPQLHEVLCAPAFLLSGDTATHLVALAELIVLGGLMIEWPQKRLAGFLAAALVLGNPIVVQLATVTHVDVALTLFIVAGFFCLDRQRFIAAGFLLGTACSVKYLGWYFAAAALANLLLFGTNRRRASLLFLGAFLIAVIPMYGRMAALTGNPFFPFFQPNPWTVSLKVSGGIAVHVTNALRLFWDISFARQRVNWQPPYSPLFALAMLITLLAAVRNRRAAFLAALCVGYIAIFTFLPQDSRYLLPLLPLVSIAAAMIVTPMLHKKYIVAATVLAIAPGVAYAGYRLDHQWPPPLTAAQRQQYLERHIPEYRALEHRGAGRIYVCGAEQLKYFGGENLLGEVAGPFGNPAIFADCRDANDLARNLAKLRIRYLLISRTHCQLAWRNLPSQPHFERVYADEAAELWRTMPP